MKKFSLLFSAVLALCAFSTLQAATKSEQVERYLGAFRYENDHPLGTVKFIFQKAVLKRQGDGKKNYEQLLFNERYFSNSDNAGRLLGIQIVYKGKTTTIRPESPKDPEEVDPAPEPKAVKTRPKAKANPPAQTHSARAAAAAIAAAAVEQEPEPEPQIDPVRPRPGNGTTGIQIPDSTTIVRNIDEAKEKITGWKGKMWQTVRPIWEFVMWVFSSVIIMLICFAGLCRYVAKTAASESLINSYGRIIVGRWIVSAHQNAAAMLLIVTWVIAIILLIDVFMWLVYLNLPVWTLILIWFPILWVAEKLTSWIVPNITVIGPGGQEHR